MKTWEVSVLVFGIVAVLAYAFYEYWNFKEKFENLL
jgi:hypothetical protein